MDFYEVISTRRSIRKYKRDEIPEDVLKRVLNAGRIAPSGSNRHAVRIIVIRDPERKKKMVPLCKGQEFVADAPVLLAACAKNLNYNRGDYMGNFSMLVDGAIVVDHMTLTARAEGLATCWIGSFSNDGIKKALSIPEDVNVVALTPLGYPASNNLFSLPKDKKELEEIVYYEKWPDNV